MPKLRDGKSTYSSADFGSGIDNRFVELIGHQTQM